MTWKEPAEHRRARDRARYPRERARRMAYQKAYYQRRRAELLAAHKAWREANWMAVKVATNWHVPMTKARRMIECNEFAQ